MKKSALFLLLLSALLTLSACGEEDAPALKNDTRVEAPGLTANTTAAPSDTAAEVCETLYSGKAIVRKYTSADGAVRYTYSWAAVGEEHKLLIPDRTYLAMEFDDEGVTLLDKDYNYCYTKYTQKEITDFYTAQITKLSGGGSILVSDIGTGDNLLFSDTSNGLKLAFHGRGRVEYLNTKSMGAMLLWYQPDSEQFSVLAYTHRQKYEPVNDELYSAYTITSDDYFALVREAEGMDELVVRGGEDVRRGRYFTKVFWLEGDLALVTDTRMVRLYNTKTMTEITSFCDWSQTYEVSDIVYLDEKLTFSVTTPKKSDGTPAQTTSYSYPPEEVTAPAPVLAEDAVLLYEGENFAIYSQADGILLDQGGVLYRTWLYAKNYINVHEDYSGHCLMFLGEDYSLSQLNLQNPAEINDKAYTGNFYMEKCQMMDEAFGDFQILIGDVQFYLIDSDGTAIYFEGYPKIDNGLLFQALNFVNNCNFVIYDQQLNKLCEDTVMTYTHTSDGRLVTDSGSFYRIFSADGKEEFTSPVYTNVLAVVDDYILVVDDGKVKLLQTDGSEVVTFCDWHDELTYHWMISGYYKQTTDDYPAGYYFLFEDSSVPNSGVEYYYNPADGSSGKIEVGEVGAYAKPVLYLYPTEETDVTVTFARPELLTTVYPSYNDGWRVSAQPDGTLTDERGRSYYCLYWEEEQTLTSRANFADGFCVAAEDSAAFLEEKLAQIGFTEREANEFIIYWLPILEQNPYNLIQFELTESREATNSLQISPAPDSLLRMAMHILPLDEAVEIQPQLLPPFERSGFAAVEWGGVVYKS
ncbi:MAG: hypothetical protein IJ493_01995 [Clostridia bacterium]|nr:hypothetical protein [Clostridia bacterium]